MSISNAIRHTLGTTKAPMTVAEINSALGGDKDYTANVHNLVQRGQVRRVGKLLPARYTLPDTAPAANDIAEPAATLARALAPSLGTCAPESSGRSVARPPSADAPPPISRRIAECPRSAPAVRGSPLQPVVRDPGRRPDFISVRHCAAPDRARALRARPTGEARPRTHRGSDLLGLGAAAVMSAIKVPSKGRAQRILHWLVGQAEPRTVPEIIEATEPGCSSQNMHGTVACLVIAGKLARVKTASGRPALVATSCALVDRRVRAPTPIDTKRKRRRADKGGVSHAPRAPRVGATTPSPVASTTHIKALADPALPDAARTTLSSLFTTVAAKRFERADIAADIAAFEAKGGVIQRLRPGESSRT